MGHTSSPRRNSNIGIHTNTFNYFEHEISPTITRLANEDLWRFSKVDMNTHKSTAIYLQTNHHDPKDKK